MEFSNANANSRVASQPTVRQSNVEEREWTMVQKRRSILSEVKKGGNREVTKIQGTERKKFLHVWRLKKNTSCSEIEEHIKSQKIGCDSIKVEQVKMKSERDYSSFIIGVPESAYDKLCDPNIWPINVEFGEWIWFHKSRNRNNISS